MAALESGAMNIAIFFAGLLALVETRPARK